MSAIATDLITLPVLVPLVGGLLCFLLRRGGWRLCAILCTVLVPALSAMIAVRVSADGVLLHRLGGWDTPLGIALRVDGLSALMLCLSGLIGAVVSLFSLGYISKSSTLAPQAPRFWSLWCFAWAGLNALFISGDVFNIYVCIELITLSVIPMLAMAEKVETWQAALRYLLLALLGSVAYLLGVGILYSEFGVLDIELLSQVVTPGLPAVLAMGLILSGLVLKTGLFPLHVWLPPAHGGAPGPVSAILSGLVVTGSYYVILRLWFTVFVPLPRMDVAAMFGVMGCAAIIWGGVQALRQDRLKLLIAYSTVSQLGYLFLVFPLTSFGIKGDLVAWTGAILFATSHGLAKAAAFLAAAALLLECKGDRVIDLRGRAAHSPMLCFAFALAGVNLMGLPPSGGFVAKWMLLKAAFLTGQWMYGIVIVLGGLLAFGYVFRVLSTMMMARDDDEEAVVSTPVLPRYASVAVLLLALSTVLLTFFSAAPLRMLQHGAPDMLPVFPQAGGEQ